VKRISISVGQFIADQRLYETVSREQDEVQTYLRDANSAQDNPAWAFSPPFTSFEGTKGG
jgi:hypothetical protein